MRCIGLVRSAQSIGRGCQQLDPASVSLYISSYEYRERAFPLAGMHGLDPKVARVHSIG